MKSLETLEREEISEKDKYLLNKKEGTTEEGLLEEDLEKMTADFIFQIVLSGKKFAGRAEKYAEKSAASIGAENSQVQKVKDELNFSERIIKLEQEELNARKKAIREISSQMIPEEEKNLLSRRDFLEKIKNGVKNVGIVAIINGISPSQAEAFLGKIFGRKSESEKEYAKDNFYTKNVEEVRKELINDASERVFAFFIDSEEVFGRKKWVEYRNAGGEISSWVPLGQIKEEFLKESYGKVKVIHTHPLKSYEIGGVLSLEEINKIKRGEAKIPPNPPSFMDISMMMRESDILGDKVADKMENEAIDATGVWRFSVNNKESNFIKQWNRYMKECANYQQFLSKEEAEILRKFGEENDETLKSIDPRMIPILSRKYPELYDIFNKLSEKVIEIAGNFLTEEDLLALNYAESLGKSIAGNIAASPKMREKRDDDISKFIKKWKEKGISISYHPTEN